MGGNQSEEDKTQKEINDGMKTRNSGTGILVQFRELQYQVGQMVLSTPITKQQQAKLDFLSDFYKDNKQSIDEAIKEEARIDKVSRERVPSLSHAHLDFLNEYELGQQNSFIPMYHDIYGDHALNYERKALSSDYDTANYMLLLPMVAFVIMLICLIGLIVIICCGAGCFVFGKHSKKECASVKYEEI